MHLCIGRERHVFIGAGGRHQARLHKPCCIKPSPYGCAAHTYRCAFPVHVVARASFTMIGQRRLEVLSLAPMNPCYLIMLLFAQPPGLRLSQGPGLENRDGKRCIGVLSCYRIHLSARHRNHSATINQCAKEKRR